MFVFLEEIKFFILILEFVLEIFLIFGGGGGDLFSGGFVFCKYIVLIYKVKGWFFFKVFVVC